MLRAGYIVSLLEKLPYDAEVDFQLNYGPEMERYGNNEHGHIFSENERIVAREKSASIILEQGF